MPTSTERSVDTDGTPDQRGLNLDRNWEIMANGAAATALELS
jgi:hypothetical protein